MNNFKHSSTSIRFKAWLLLSCWLSYSLLALWMFEKDNISTGFLCSTNLQRNITNGK